MEPIDFLCAIRRQTFRESKDKLGAFDGGIAFSIHKCNMEYVDIFCNKNSRNHVLEWIRKIDNHTYEQIILFYNDDGKYYFTIQTEESDHTEKIKEYEMLELLHLLSYSYFPPIDVNGKEIPMRRP